MGKRNKKYESYWEMSNTEKIALARKQQGGKDLGGEEGV